MVTAPTLLVSSGTWSVLNLYFVSTENRNRLFKMGVQVRGEIRRKKREERGEEGRGGDKMNKEKKEKKEREADKQKRRDEMI